ncbi:MAG: FHA domain-containing protein, partial [Ktedonobacteraceae bacterium]
MQYISFPTWLSYGSVACGLLLIGIGIYYQMRRKRDRLHVTTTVNANAQPPRRQPGVPAPFAYNAATPWGWLEYRNGNFLGQELALKRAIISIGREPDNEIELDDDTISRYHAELAWENGLVYVIDNYSLIGV